MVPAIFLDRDGTIIRDADYLARPSQIEVLPNAVAGLHALRDAGFRLIVCSNQSGVARGFFDEDAVRIVNEALATMLMRDGAPIDAWYHCPHLPGAAVARYDVACECRKPAPGMILRAAAEHAVDLARSYAVGDRERDLEAGRAAGCRGGVLIGPGPASPGEVRAGDLLAAARWIIGDARPR
jgi:D-glycero-D-manno-heptose 1,7-bisphosphate phosphatase